jgi:hypothetical protein
VVATISAAVTPRDSRDPAKTKVPGKSRSGMSGSPRIDSGSINAIE